MTRRKPAAMLAEEAERLHRIPDIAHTVAFGLARTVSENTPMVTFENAQCSVPARLVVCGSSGTGKTFFLEALGQQAVEAGMRVAWFRLEDLGVLIRATAPTTGSPAPSPGSCAPSSS